jgi:hypothetical protein
MSATHKTRRIRGAAFLVGLVALLAASGCGESDFKNESRPAVPVELGGVIKSDRVDVEPSDVRAGPVKITISNQTDDAHTVTLEGESTEERVGPINPLDTATIQKTLRPGTYLVRAGSAAALPKEIPPAELDVGPKRRNSNGKVLQP